MKNLLPQVSSAFTTLSLAFISRIAISQASMALAGLAWLIDVGKRRAWRSVLLPDFLYPLSAYAMCSAAAGRSPWIPPAA